MGWVIRGAPSNSSDNDDNDDDDNNDSGDDVNSNSSSHYTSEPHVSLCTHSLPCLGSTCPQNIIEIKCKKKTVM